MNDMPGREPITSGDFSVARGAAVQRAAFGEQFRASRTVDRTIDAATPEQGRIRRVDDGVNAKCRDVGDSNLEPRRTRGAISPRQAAGALIATPLSVSNC